MKKTHVRVVGKLKSSGYYKALKDAGLKATKKKTGKNTWKVSYWKK